MITTKETSEQIQSDLLALLDGLPQDAQDRACQIVCDGLKALQIKLDKESAKRSELILQISDWHTGDLGAYRAEQRGLDVGAGNNNATMIARRQTINKLKKLI